MNARTYHARSEQLIDSIVETVIGAYCAGEAECEFKSPLIFDWTEGANVMLGDALEALLPRIKSVSPSMLLSEPANDIVGCSYCGKGVVRRSDPAWVIKAREHCKVCKDHPIFRLGKACELALQQFEAARDGGRLLRRDTVIDELKAALAGGGS